MGHIICSKAQQSRRVGLGFCARAARSFGPGISEIIISQWTNEGDEKEGKIFTNSIAGRAYKVSNVKSLGRGLRIDFYTNNFHPSTKCRESGVSFIINNKFSDFGN